MDAAQNGRLGTSCLTYVEHESCSVRTALPGSNKENLTNHNDFLEVPNRK